MTEFVCEKAFTSPITGFTYQRGVAVSDSIDTAQHADKFVERHTDEGDAVEADPDGKAAAKAAAAKSKK